MSLVLSGRCWRFGDNLPIDGAIMPRRYASERIVDPIFLSQHIFEEIDPEIAKNVKAGDIIVAGKRFAHGNPHVQGFYGIKGAGLGLLVESLPRGAFRNAIHAGVPTLPSCPNITRYVNTGDELEVDFRSGLVKNITLDKEYYFDPLPDFLLEIVETGGSNQFLKKQLKIGG